MKRRTFWAVATTIVFAVLVTSLISAEWAMRPFIDYFMTGYDYDVPGVMMFDFNPYGVFSTTTMPLTYTIINQNTPLMIDLHYGNEGTNDASLLLEVTVKNANITWFSNFELLNETSPFWGTQAEGRTYNGTTFSLVSNVSGQSGMQHKFINILPVGKPQKFTVSCSLKGTSNLFFSQCPNGITTATYELASDNVYKLVN